MNQLEAHTFFNDLAHSITKDEIEKQQKVIQDITARHRDFARVLNKATADYILTGIGRIPEPNWVGWVAYGDRSRFTWDGYFDKLSKSLKRPLVFVSPARSLTLTKRRYTEPLWGSLMLTAEKKTNRWECSSFDATVTYRLTGDRVYFTFYNEQGKKLLDSWLNQCATDPAFRRALRLEK